MEQVLKKDSKTRMVGTFVTAEGGTSREARQSTAMYSSARGQMEEQQRCF